MTDTKLDTEHVDRDIVMPNQRIFYGYRSVLFIAVTIIYALFHIICLNIYPLESWTYRILHVTGAVGIGFILYSSKTFSGHGSDSKVTQGKPYLIVSSCALLLVLYAIYALGMINLKLMNGEFPTPEFEKLHFGYPLTAATVIAIVAGFFQPRLRHHISISDICLVLAMLASSYYLLINLDTTALRMRAGTNFVTQGNVYAALSGMLLLLELTRRLTGSALVVIILAFVGYGFAGPMLPGFLNHNGFHFNRLITYLYTDKGILGTTTAVSSTYIILFIIFAAFLQVSKVGEYFVNFSFALAGRKRGGPAKVAIFSSGLMGTINGTSAGNVVATGSLTIPLMQRVGYKPKEAASIEAAASTGGQIMPPIMGAGAFIMAEITGIPYTEIVVAAVLPAIFYFFSIYLMVDTVAARENMLGLPKDQIPKLGLIMRQAYLFMPILILIIALFLGYSVIRSGSLAIIAAVVVSWLTPHKVGIRSIGRALNTASVMSVQIITVCAAAGIIVGCIALTGIGARFSSMLLAVAENSQLLALMFAMLISIILGMGMPTTAAYAIAASVVAPGLIEIGIEPLTAHFFVFYYAVLSAITPPVALASYAAAGISNSNPMETSITSFKVGIVAFAIPYMAYFNPVVFMDGSYFEIAYTVFFGIAAIYLMIGSIQGWLFGRATKLLRLAGFVYSIPMIMGVMLFEITGVILLVALYLKNRKKAAVADLA
ncbi:TRAP transporter permease [Vibrio gallicus]|uniref:TRAP transporter permease n=1 Tax=Vibrio gallicus TaxID=190897 RepID=UPI0021C390C6|nr:TRAP transporter fused permease subunit [Vibrio gallicus]